MVQRLLIAKEFGDRAAERRAYCNLGNTYIFLGEFEVAAEHYKSVPSQCNVPAHGGRDCLGLKAACVVSPQEDAAAGEAAEGPSCGGSGLLQSGQHLHAPAGL